MSRQRSPPPKPLSEEHSPLAVAISQQMNRGRYECVICTESIRGAAAVWSCNKQCFRVFHLHCIKKWAKSEGSGAGTSFRCPSCQCQYPKHPQNYLCFCGKQKDPLQSAYCTPHSCGEQCGRSRDGCPHPCPLLCHPGPCPDCTYQTRPIRCPCGKNAFQHQCGKPDPHKTCDDVCGKRLSCGNHKCNQPCHFGPCKPCAVVQSVRCTCGQTAKDLPCGAASYQCDTPCNKTLRCGVHKCDVICHGGGCPPCSTDPSIVMTCPCGQENLKGKREKCSDPIPTCENTCGKVLLCGGHTCALRCHDGPCPPCKEKVNGRCRCQRQASKINCSDLADFRCGKMCKTQLSCRKHNCTIPCCVDRDRLEAPVHVCQQVCVKQLPCGHKCNEPCHRGMCPPCMNIVTHELACACGATRLMPPQPCGTQPPTCHLPCTQAAECGHPVTPHQCHFGACPPCTCPVDKECSGGHCMVQGVQCHIRNISCGKTCEKELDCGHLCAKKCHVGPCLEPGKKCHLPCGKKLLLCGHNCRQKCHKGGCPPCTTQVPVRCECDHLEKKVSCQRYDEMKAELVKEFGERAPPPSLVCTDDCFHNKRLEALASVGGGFGSVTRGRQTTSHKTVYSPRLWEAAKRSIDTVCAIEHHLGDFVRSSGKNHMLPPMSREKRALVHELAMYYAVDCEAVDREPNRSCYLSKTTNSHGTASCIPSPLLSEAVYDDSSDPQQIFDRLTTGAAAAKHVIVCTGPNAHETAIYHALKGFIGQFVLVSPNARLHQVAFVTPQDMASAFSHLRRMTDLTFSFNRLGEAPPPRSVDGVSQPVPASHVDPTAPKPAPKAKKSTGGSWAQMVRQNKDEAKDSGPTFANRFSALK